MERVIMWIMAIGAVLGGLDKLLGNKFGLGKQFEQGFLLMGPMALPMVGILCLVPVIGAGLRVAILPLFTAIGLDPGMLACLLAPDMGGYQLAKELSLSPAVVKYSGMVLAATLGCTVSYTIPVGMSMIPRAAKPLFARGTLIGVCMLPVTMCVGGLLCGLAPLPLLRQSLPVLVLVLILAICIWRIPAAMVKGFSVFAQIISAIATIGLILGAFTFMTGLKIIPNLAPIEDAMEIVGAVAVVMLGSLTIAEILKILLRKPFAWVSKRTGMNATSVAGLLMGVVSVTPALALVRDMDDRGKVVNAALCVSGASALAGHMGYAFGVDPTAVVPLLAAKFSGAIAGAIVALLLTKKQKETDCHA